jgi:hypothetical protein
MDVESKLSTLLSSLHGVIKTQNGYMAFCPAHDDKKTRSLGVKIGNNGGILIKCFGGCGIDTILSSIAMNMSDLYPDKPDYRPLHQKNKDRPRFSRYELFPTLAFEAFVIYTFAQILRGGGVLTIHQWARMDRAMRIIGAVSDEVSL